MLDSECPYILFCYMAPNSTGILTQYQPGVHGRRTVTESQTGEAVNLEMLYEPPWANKY